MWQGESALGKVNEHRPGDKQERDVVRNGISLPAGEYLMMVGGCSVMYVGWVDGTVLIYLCILRASLTVGQQGVCTARRNEEFCLRFFFPHGQELYWFHLHPGQVSNVK